MGNVVEQDGPVAILEAFDRFRVVCAECRWRGPLRMHRLDAQDDFDNHDHTETQ